MAGRTQLFNGAELPRPIWVNAYDHCVTLTLGTGSEIPMCINQAKRLRDALDRAIEFSADSFDRIEVAQ